MPAQYESGFQVRKPAWHGMGNTIDDYPETPEQARILAGLDWDPIIEETYRKQIVVGEDGTPTEIYVPVPGHNAIVRSDTGNTLAVMRDTYQLITNKELFEIVQALLEQDKVKFETAGVLQEGRAVWVLAYLDTPIQLPGDNSPIFPYLGIVNRHDGMGSCQANLTTVRIVCANTAGAAEMEGKRTGAFFNFRHTKNWRDRVQDARSAINGLKDETDRYVEFATELLGMEVSDDQREAFIAEFAPMPPDGLISTWVRNHVEGVRDDLRLIFNSPTTAPVKGTAYGCVQAAVEYLDHVRGYRNQGTYLNRTMLRAEPLKGKAVRIIERVLTDDTLVAKAAEARRIREEELAGASN